MSFVNSRGDIWHGVGGGFANLNNVAISRGGAAGFIDDDLAFYANGDAGWVAYVYNLRTGEQRPAVADPNNEQFGQTINHGFAGGGVWAGWQGVNNSHAGLYSSTGFRIPGGGLLGCGPDGAICFKADYQSDGPTLVAELPAQARVAAAVAAGQRYESVAAQLQAEGLIWPLTPSHAYEPQLLGDRRAIWQEALQIRVAGIPQPQQLGRCWRPQAYLVDGRWWVSYFSDKGIVLHPFDSFVGYRITMPGVDEWYNARQLPDGSVFFALSSSIAEQAGQLYGLIVDLRAGHITEASSGTRLAEVEERFGDLSKPLPVELTKVTRPLYVGFFEFFAGLPSQISSPGNCALAVRGIQGAASAERPIIVTGETVGLIWGPLLGFFCGGSTVEEVEAQAEAAANARQRPVAYWDARRWPRPPKLPAGSWVCVQAYQNQGESLEVFERETARSLSEVAAYRVALVAQCYTSNLSLTTELEPIVGAMSRLAEANNAVVAVLAFSGPGRKTGLGDHPEVLPLWQRFASSVQQPAFEEFVPMPVRPAITVKSFAPKLEPGKAAKIVEARIGDTDVTVRLDAQGNLFLDAKNTAGEDHTVAKRHVDIGGAAAPPPPPPTPPPDPTPPPAPAATTTVFQTTEGSYLRLGAGGRIDATGKAEDLDSQFLVENVAERQIALKAANGKYVTAEGGGGGVLIANRAKVEGWETFGVVAAPGGRIALQASGGEFVSPQNGGGGDVMVDGPKVGPWEPLRMAGPRGPQQQRSGLVRADGRAIADGAGKFQPLGLSFFWALWGWLNGEESRVRQWLEWARDHGFDFQRNFAEVGGASWEDRVIDPRGPLFVDTLKKHIDVSWGEYGIRVQLSVFAAMLGNPRESMEKVKAAIRGRTEGVLYVEGANEQNFPDHAQLRQLVKELRQEFPELLAGTCSMVELTDQSADLDVASMGILHTERGRGDEDWRQVRQGCEVMGLSKTCSCQEPPGLESSVEVLSDPLRLAALRLVSAISGMPSFVLHTGAGIRGGGAADRARGRKADIWEYGDQIEQVVAALHALDGKLPEDAPSWRKFKGHWPEARLVSDAVWSDDPAHIDHGVVRLNGSYSDNAFACAAYGIRRFSELTARFGAWNLKGYDVLTGAQVLEQHVAEGEVFRLEGDPSGGSNKAVLILGTR